MADEYSLPYRVQQLERIGEKRDAQLDRIVDRQDEGYRRLERASMDISSMMTTMAQLKAAVDATTKALNEDASRKQYAAEQDELDRQWWRRTAAAGWFAVSFIGILVSVLGGFLHSAWTQLADLLKGVSAP